ncbi:MAG: AbrB/MazE/SpoVT family DNA-binding domain-containing protein [bacterium]|nr:AbrB/MazE/SpoVT family DNA-binding domain-containing protein [bacterium]
MNTVTLSPKFQVVIPKAVRDSMKLRSGMKLEVILFGERIELIPIQPISTLKGFLKGMDTTITRDKDRL